ncbi:10142_t:CDS:2, partial [Racocetra fulgida]
MYNKDQHDQRLRYLIATEQDMAAPAEHPTNTTFFVPYPNCTSNWTANSTAADISMYTDFPENGEGKGSRVCEVRMGVVVDFEAGFDDVEGLLSYNMLGYYRLLQNDPQ